MYLELLPSYIGLRSILLCAGVFLFLWWCLQRPRNLPPGPWGIPFLGALPTLAFALYRTRLAPHKLFARLSSKYGKIFSLQLGGTLVVVLNSYDCIREAFQNRRLNDRPHSPLLDEVNLKPGVSSASGQSWKQQRKFTLSTLRDFGVGKRSFEEQILTEAKVLVNEFQLQEHVPFDPHHLISNAVSNVICSVVFGKRYEYSNENFKRMLELFSQQIKLLGSASLQTFFPIAKYLQPNTRKLIKENIVHQMQFIHKVIEEHRKAYDPDNLNDFIDVFLKEIRVNQKEGLESHLNEDTLVTTITSLFAAGSETTATTLLWGLLYLIAYPDIQCSIHKEIDDVVGRKRLPLLSDIPNLPYTEATLLEIQRITAILPLGSPHCAAEDTSLNGFYIPKGTFLISNLWAVHHDPDIWEDPSEFNPSRFLDQSGNVRPRQELIPFSVGRRICLGENLAKMELFLFFSHLLHQFSFTKSNDSCLSFEGIVGGVYAPRPFKIIALPRK